jgi:hypothetical protein
MSEVGISIASMVMLGSGQERRVVEEKEVGKRKSERWKSLINPYEDH